MTSNAENETPCISWQDAAALRIFALWDAKDSQGLWGILSNPANRVSRKALQIHGYRAPSVNAPIKEWKSFLAENFPDFEEKLAKDIAAKKAEIERSNAEFEAIALERVAKSGPRYKHGTEVYDNALEFVKALFTKGYRAGSRGKGIVVFKGPENVFIGPLRRAPINAALKLLGLGVLNGH